MKNKFSKQNIFSISNKILKTHLFTVQVILCKEIFLVTCYVLGRHIICVYSLPITSARRDIYIY